MTKLSHLTVLAVIAVPMSASAAVVSMGSGYAVSCYEAAEGTGATLRALDDCNHALAEQALPPEERVGTLVNRGIILLRRSDVQSANADFDAADEQLAAIDAAGWDKIAFTWRGPIGDLAEPFYYRVQGPRISIELRNTEDHVHTVTRDPVNDYGEAWLGLEYRETITAAERSAAARRAAE